MVYLQGFLSIVVVEDADDEDDVDDGVAVDVDVDVNEYDVNVDYADYVVLNSVMKSQPMENLWNVHLMLAQLDEKRRKNYKN